MSRYRSKLKAGLSDPPQKRTSDLYLCCIYPRERTVWMAQEASQLLHSI